MTLDIEKPRVPQKATTVATRDGSMADFFASVLDVPAKVPEMAIVPRLFCDGALGPFWQAIGKIAKSDNAIIGLVFIECSIGYGF